jgi:hypothetical protein
MRTVSNQHSDLVILADPTFRERLEPEILMLQEGALGNGNKDTFAEVI